MWVIPDFRIWVIFLQGEKFLVEQKFARQILPMFLDSLIFFQEKSKNVFFFDIFPFREIK
jgi:hypothetical protein